jgi:hypothetical protein
MTDKDFQLLRIYLISGIICLILSAVYCFTLPPEYVGMYDDGGHRFLNGR